MKDKKKRKCRSPSKVEKLTEQDIRELMSHSSYERGPRGRVRQRAGLVVLK